MGRPGLLELDKVFTPLQTLFVVLVVMLPRE